MTAKSNTRTVKLVQLSFLSALIIVLQFMSYFIKPVVIGGIQFNFSFVLVPIVIGGVMLGKRAGAILGFVFGLVTFICCVFGLDAGGNVLFIANPFYTFITCFVKSIAAGYFSSAVYEILAYKIKKPIAGIITAAVIAPVTNTLLFCIAMFTMFRPTLVSWAAGKETLVFIITGLVGLNFIVELLLNLIACPTLYVYLRLARLINDSKNKQ